MTQWRRSHMTRSQIHNLQSKICNLQSPRCLPGRWKNPLAKWCKALPTGRLAISPMMFLDHYPTPLFFLFRHRDLCEYDRPAVLQN
jgi:hypothetical protein